MKRLTGFAKILIYIAVAIATFAILYTVAPPLKTDKPTRPPINQPTYSDGRSH